MNRPSAETVEEANWLFSFGVHPEQIARQLGMNLPSVERAYYRAGGLPAPWVRDPRYREIREPREGARP